RRCGLRTGRELERLCDMLAAELLMPRAAFGECVEGRPSLKSVREAARVFKTSLAAACIRASELYGTVVFEVENGALSWSRGLRSIDATLREAIDGALNGHPSEEPVYVRVGRSQRTCSL